MNNDDDDVHVLYSVPCVYVTYVYTNKHTFAYRGQVQCADSFCIMTFTLSHADSAECDNKSVLDLSKQQLQKIPKHQSPPDVAQHVRVLILDENELQKIDNVDSYMQIEHVRAQRGFGNVGDSVPHD